MFIANATYKTISTEGQTFPIAEGTIISNGIVPQTIDIEPPTHRISVAVGGTIDLTSEANKGVSFTDEQIKALGSDFNFVPASEKELPTPKLADAGKVVAVNETGTEYELVESGSGLPEVTSSDEGKVLAVNASGEWAASAQPVVFVDYTDDGIAFVSSKTWGELFSMMQTTVVVLRKIIPNEINCFYISMSFYDEDGYYIVINEGANQMTWITDTPNGYPSYAYD